MAEFTFDYRPPKPVATIPLPSECLLGRRLARSDDLHALSLSESLYRHAFCAWLRYFGLPRVLEVVWMSKPGQLVLVALRKMIATGELTAGERLMELPTAERFGVSRMPVRMAFRTLEQEGLLVRFGGRGFQVRSMSADDIAGAVEVRGVLEGLAARQAAERGLSDQNRVALEQCLAQGDQLFEKGYVTEDDLELYHDLNVRFHRVIIEASHNPAIAAALARNNHLPFASVTALAVDQHDMALEYRRFNYAHMQHHSVFDALVNGQSARAEAIMCEHANATLRYAETFGSAAIPQRMKIILGSP